MGRKKLNTPKNYAHQKIETFFSPSKKQPPSALITNQPAANAQNIRTEASTSLFITPPTSPAILIPQEEHESSNSSENEGNHSTLNIIKRLKNEAVEIPTEESLPEITAADLEETHSPIPIRVRLFQKHDSLSQESDSEQEQNVTPCSPESIYSQSSQEETWSLNQQSWIARVAETLRAYSNSRGSFNHMKQEWVFTGNVEDLHPDEGTCELCDHSPIRYQFEIKNILNSNTLSIGSKCVKQFVELGLRAQPGNRIFDEQESENFIHETVKEVTTRAQQVRRFFNSF